MGEDNEVGAKGKEVQVFVVDVVGSIESDQSRQKAPAAEKSSRESGNLSFGARTIEGSPSKMSGSVALNGVEYGESNDLAAIISLPVAAAAIPTNHEQPVR